MITHQKRTKTSEIKDESSDSCFYFKSVYIHLSFPANKEIFMDNKQKLVNTNRTVLLSTVENQQFKLVFNYLDIALNNLLNKALKPSNWDGACSLVHRVFQIAVRSGG